MGSAATVWSMMTLRFGGGKLRPMLAGGFSMLFSLITL
jgi:hypothetical protein